MQHIDTLLDLTRDRTPWSLVRMNDGEHRCMFKQQQRISRGQQVCSPQLRQDLLNALKHRQLNYWIGLPCGKCYGSYRQRQLKVVDDDYPYLTHAVVISNRNHERFQEEFPEALKDRRVAWIGGVDQVPSRLPFKLEQMIAVPDVDAYEWWNRTAAHRRMKEMPGGSVVLCACGPLGRVIAHQWFSERPDLTVVDVGSRFDPITMGRLTAKIHRGELPPCPECN